MLSLQNVVVQVSSPSLAVFFRTVALISRLLRCVPVPDIEICTYVLPYFGVFLLSLLMVHVRSCTVPCCYREETTDLT
jgi:hypothetical protein